MGLIITTFNRKWKRRHDKIKTSSAADVWSGPLPNLRQNLLNWPPTAVFEKLQMEKKNWVKYSGLQPYMCGCENRWRQSGGWGKSMV